MLRQINIECNLVGLNEMKYVEPKKKWSRKKKQMYTSFTVVTNQ